MYFENTRRAIEEHFRVGWAAGAHSTVPVEYENVPAAPSKPFLAVFIVDGNGVRITLGNTNATRRFSGSVVVEIFIKAGIGTSQARLYADTVSSIFEDAQISYGNSGSILFRTPVYRGIGVQGDWYKARVSIPFERDAQYTAASQVP